MVLKGLIFPAKIFVLSSKLFVIVQNYFKLFCLLSADDLLLPLLEDTAILIINKIVGYKRFKIWMITFMDDPSFKQVSTSLGRLRIKILLQSDEPILTYFLHNRYIIVIRVLIAQI